MKIVIIGGVAGGATAAARIRRLDEQAEIVVFERSGFISYANCGLPYYIGGTIEDENELTLQTPESFWRRFRVKMNVHHEVTAIHPDSKTVTVKNLENGKILTESYDKLVLSPGAKPIKPGFDGIDSDKIFTLRTVEDTLRLKKYTDENQPKSAVVVGGGFIGIEVAENLRELGIDVTLVEAADQLMAPFDRDMASFIHAEIRKNSIHLMLDTMVEGFADTDCGIDVKLKNAPTLHTDMVVMAIGVAPETTLAKDAGLELGIKGSIVVNDKMETSIPDIYAVGDAVQIKNFVTDTDTLISLAGPANKQGRIAADNICGGDSHYTGGQGSSVIKIFDMTAAATGINEKTAKSLGIATDKVILSPMSHAGYYPGGKMMTMKVLFEKESYRILGAQIVGFDGVDKRIDVLATAIRAGIKANAFTYDDCIDLFFSVKPEYRSHAVWLMNDRTALALHKLKDDAGNYLWNGNSDTILGKPVHICNDMPDIAAGAKPVLFGDFRYFWIIDRSPISMRAFKERFAMTDQVGYVGFELLDSRLVRKDAIKVLTVTA